MLDADTCGEHSDSKDFGFSWKIIQKE